MLLKSLLFYCVCAFLTGEDGEVHSSKDEMLITPPVLTASSGPDAAVVVSSSVTPEPVRAYIERPKNMEDVILVKFVHLFSFHTTSVNETRVSETSMFQVLLCLNVLQVVVLMESRRINVWSRHSDNQIFPHMLSRSCFKAVWLKRQGNVGMVVRCRIGTAVLRWQ